MIAVLLIVGNNEIIQMHLTTNKCKAINIGDNNDDDDAFSHNIGYGNDGDDDYC